MITISIVILIVILSVYWYYHYHTTTQTSKRFYNIVDTYPNLKAIHPLRSKIMKELDKVINWIDWPEKELYDHQGEWKIFPLFAFNIWVQDNCNKLPTLTKFIKNIPNLKTAILSKLSPKMKLKPHQGWGKHSNTVLRAHYGLIVPEDKCYIGVSDPQHHINNPQEKQYHKNDEWLVFDDAKMHMAENTSDQDRIVLILDILRPPGVKQGESLVKDTKELTDIVNAFRTSLKK
jgi:aspartyl/asparaginyl beta-hydroxylase (cupin superfamily)